VNKYLHVYVMNYEAQAMELDAVFNLRTVGDVVGAVHDCLDSRYSRALNYKDNVYWLNGYSPVYFKVSDQMWVPTTVGVDDELVSTMEAFNA